MNILKHYKEPNSKNILNITICYKLRQVLKKYYNVINILFKDTKIDDENKIKYDIKIILIKMNMHKLQIIILNFILKKIRKLQMKK